MPEKCADFAVTSVDKLHFRFPQLGRFSEAIKTLVVRDSRKNFQCVGSPFICSRFQRHIPASLNSNAPESGMNAKYLVMTYQLRLSRIRARAYSLTQSTTHLTYLTHCTLKVINNKVTEIATRSQVTHIHSQHDYASKRHFEHITIKALLMGALDKRR